jgi:hypothetical protein
MCRILGYELVTVDVLVTVNVCNRYIFKMSIKKTASILRMNTMDLDWFRSSCRIIILHLIFIILCYEI